MKTKNGQCDSCELLKCSATKNFLISNTSDNVSNCQIFVCCDYSIVNISNVVSLFKNEYPDVKYIITDNHYCAANGEYDKKQVICNCFGNIKYLIERCQPDNSVSVGTKYDESIKYLNDEDELKAFLKTVYGKKEETKEEKPLDCYMFSIPDEYYTDKYRLVDVQYNRNQNRLFYIFRDKDNKKHYYEFPKYDKDYYWYEAIQSNKIIEKIENLKLCTGKYKDRNPNINAYGGDSNITLQHSVDYFLRTRGEAPIVRQNVLFFDIETYQYHDNIFPDPSKAMYPITAISFRTDDPNDSTHVYLLKLEGEIDPRVDEAFKSGKYPFITLFNDETTMLRTWFAAVKKCDVDFLAGWNVSGFDIPYIAKRMSNLGIKPKEFSPLDDVYADKTGRNSIGGYVVMDQLKLYKDFTYITLPSYSLNYVAGVVLGKEKVQHVGKSIDVMYREDIELFMKYSQVDTDLVYEIEEDVRHIALQDEIRRVSTTSHDGAKSTIGQADGIYTTSLKKRGLIARNYTHNINKESLPGAYVFDARGGRYLGLLCDFDFRSLYPSIINTWNIGPDTFIAQIREDVAYNYLFYKEKLRGSKIEVTVDPIHAAKRVSLALDKFEEFLTKYKAQVTIVGTIFCGHEIHESINYGVLTMLMDSRKLYKAKMLNAKEAGEKQLTVEYNGKQMAYKILANSLYGVLGNEHFKFYNPNLGKSITLTGQEMLKYCAVHTDYFMLGKFKSKEDFKIDPLFADKVNSTKNILYGDTDSVFVYLTDYLKNKNIEVKKSPEVLKEVDNIQNFINGVIIPTLLAKHRINMKYSAMYLKNEFLMSVYYALNAKKKYASKVISQEGKDICERDIKGLEIKRSEIPSRSQKLLSDIIDIILDENNKNSQLKEKIDKLVNEARSEMLKLLEEGDCSVSRVVAFSKDISEYKVMSQNIKGMLMWNSLVGKEDFKTGSKGHLWNILGIDLSKAPKEIVDNYYNIFKKQYTDADLRSIAIPEEIDHIPDYYIVDIKTMIKYCCDDRVNLILEPLWTESDEDLLF